jgi:hypothetical protein
MTHADLLTKARPRRDAEIRRRAAPPPPRYVRPPQGVTWRPTLSRAENDRVALDPTDVVLRKAWDTSPVDQSSFDPTQPPALVAPPVNTAPPVIQLLTGLAVGDQLAGTIGAWTGTGIIYTRQWLRGSTPIAGATLPGSFLVAADVGLMIGLTLTATNTGGAGSASAVPVGPVTAA